MNYRDVLGQYDDDFQKSKEATGANEPIPDGSYQAMVNAARIVESKETFRPMLEWELAVVTGPYEGRKEWLRQFLDNANNYPFVKRNLRVCGVQMERLSELPGVLDQLLNTVIEITIKTTKKGDKDYRNVYFDRRIDLNGGLDSDGEEVPF